MNSSSTLTRASGTCAPTPMTLNPEKPSVKTSNRFSNLLPATPVQGKSTPLPSLSIIPLVTLKESQSSSSPPRISISPISAKLEPSESQSTSVPSYTSRSISSDILEPLEPKLSSSPPRISKSLISAKTEPSESQSTSSPSCTSRSLTSDKVESSKPESSSLPPRISNSFLLVKSESQPASPTYQTRSPISSKSELSYSQPSSSPSHTTRSNSSMKPESQECSSPSHPATSNSLLRSEPSESSSTEIVFNLVDTSDIKPLSGLLRDPFQPDLILVQSSTSDECFPVIPNELVTCPGLLDAEPVINLNMELKDCEVEEPQTKQILKLVQESPISSPPDHTSLLETKSDPMDCVDQESANFKNIQNIDIQNVLKRNILLMTKNSIKRKGTQFEDVPEAKRAKPDLKTSNKKFSPPRNEERTNSIDSNDDVLPYTKCLRCFQFFKAELYLAHAQTEHDYNCSGCNCSFPSTGPENDHIILQHRFQCTMQFAKDTQLTVQKESFINTMSNEVLPEESKGTMSKASSKLKRKKPRKKEEVNLPKRQSKAKRSSETLNQVLMDHCYMPSILIKTILGHTSSDTDSVCSQEENFDKSEQILDESEIYNTQNYVLAQDTEPVMSVGIEESLVSDELLLNGINSSNSMESTISPYFSSTTPISSVSQLSRSNTRELSMAVGLSHLPSSRPSIAEKKSKMSITDDSLSECNSLLLVSQASTHKKKPALNPILLPEVILSPPEDLSLQPVDAQLGLSKQTNQTQLNFSKELDDQALGLSVKQNTVAKVAAPENAFSEAAFNVKSATVAEDNAANKARADAFINEITTAIGKIRTGAEMVAELKPVAKANIVEEVNKVAEANKVVGETINEAKIASEAKTDPESKTRISNREETNPEVKESDEASGFGDEIAPESSVVKARIASESVVETEIAFKSVYEDQKAHNSQVEGKTAPDSIDEGDLDLEPVVKAKIDSEPIVEDKISPESGFEDKITLESVVEGKLDHESVVDDKIDSDPTDEDKRAPESGVVEAEIAPESRVKTKTSSESRVKTKTVAESRVETKAATESRVKTRLNSKPITKPKVPTYKEETQKDNTRAKASLNQPTSSQANKKVKLAEETVSSKLVSSPALDKKPTSSSSLSTGKKPTGPAPQLSASVARYRNYLNFKLQSFTQLDQCDIYVRKFNHL